MIECYSCGAEFDVEFGDDFSDAEVTFCPHCGTNLDVEVDFEES